MKEMMRYMTGRKTYLEDLCEYYSEPEGVADHLKNHPPHSRDFSRELGGCAKRISAGHQACFCVSS